MDQRSGLTETMETMPGIKLVILVCAGAAIVFSCGCRPETEVYVDREEVAKLPEKHKTQLRQYLTRYFGTPGRPRRMRPDRDVATKTGKLTLVNAASPGVLRHGQRVYAKRCAPCHGVTGDGQGSAAPYLKPKPRDFRMGRFKFTSTPRGAKPRRADLERTIRRGAKGTAMPSFRWLPNEDLEAVVDYVILLSQRGELESQLIRESELELDEGDDYDPEVVAEFVERIAKGWDTAEEQIVRPQTPQPPYDDRSIALGWQAFQTRGCAKCHGEDGRGQTTWLSPRYLAAQAALPESERAEINYDDWGNVAPAADLTAGMLHGGRRPVDIYRRIYSGINGTPMPAFATALQDEPDTIWHLVHYVLSIVERRAVSPQAKAALPPIAGPGEVESESQTTES